MTWKVVITRPAQQDMREISSYIRDRFLMPHAAQRIYLAIRNEILSLSFMPERYAVIDEPPYAQVGVRRMTVENYLVFYIAARDTATVTVLRVLYNRREWKLLLSEEIH